MSFRSCLSTLEQAGDISRAEAEALARRFDDLRRQNAKDGPGFADEAARDLLAKQLEAEGAHKKVQLALTVKALKRIDADLAGSSNSLPDAALNLLAYNTAGAEKFSSVEARQGALLGQAHARMEAVLHEFRRTALLGRTRNRARLDNLVKEAFGEASGDEAAKGLAHAWAETHEWLRRRFNAAGGAIAKLENWGLPQSHDARALRAAGLQEWKRRITPLLDTSRMRHALTGDALAPDTLDALLDYAFESVTTDGWAHREPAMAAFGKGAIANQRAEHRVLIFKDAESWLAYQRDFGEGDPFAAMMAHVNRMARDVAAMEILGPNPNAMVEWLKQSVEKAAAGKSESRMNEARRTVRRLEQLWAAQRGALETPVDVRVADGFAIARNYVTSSIMGSATLVSAAGDLSTSMVARAFSGLPVARTGLDIVKQFAPSNRREAVAAGLILETAMHTLHKQARYAGSLGGPEWSRWLADRTLTWSGLTPWTGAARQAGGLAFMRELGERADQAFEKLPGGLRRTLANWGFDAARWDKLRAAGTYETAKGVHLLRPTDVAAKDDALGLRFHEMIQGEIEVMVPAGSVRSKSFMVTERPGTLWGELQRSMGQLKSFAALFIMLHTGRIAQLGGWRSASGAAYAGSLLIGTTLAGAAAMQLGSIAQGRDPETVLDARFWGAALLKGGGLGLFGDLLFADLNRFGGGLGRTLQGPMTQHLWDLWTLTGGNAVELARDGEAKHAGRELAQVLKSNTPGGSLWYARLAYERLLIDQLQHLVDPEANKAFKARQKRWLKERGQDFWWDPGAAAPDRAPDLGNAVAPPPSP